MNTGYTISLYLNFVISVLHAGRDFNTLPNRTFVPFILVAQNVCCLSLLREMVLLLHLDRGRAIALILQGRSQRDIAQQFGVHESTISRLVQCLRATGRLTDRPRSGRSRVTTQRQDRHIRLVHLRNRLKDGDRDRKRSYRKTWPSCVSKDSQKSLAKVRFTSTPSLRGPKPYAQATSTPHAMAACPCTKSVSTGWLAACNVQRWITIFASEVR